MFTKLGFMLFVGFLLTSTISYLVSRQSIRHAILENELPLSSDNIYSEIQRDLFEPILISSLMANDTFVKDWILKGEQDTPAILQYLKHIKDKYQTVTSFLVSAKTHNYYQAERILKVVNQDIPADAWFFRVEGMEAPYEINVDPDMANRDAMTIFINYRMLDHEGRFIGATGVGLGVNAVKTLMKDYRSRYHREVYFYNRKGSLVLNSLPSQVDEFHRAHSEEAMESILKKVDAGDLDINFSAVGQNGSMANYRYIPELDWILVVEQKSDGTRPILFRSFALNLVICLLTAILLLSLIRKTILSYQANLECRNEQLHEKNLQIERQATDLARANKNLDALHRDKDEFIGITVHDLKNPLSSVIGFAELLQSDSQLSSENRDFANCITLSSKSMLEQVEDLLKLTELEAPTVPTLKTVDARVIVQCVAHQYSFQARSKHISISLDQPETRAYVETNETWLISAVQNLVSNAIKYSPANSKVSIRLTKSDEEVEIAVQDQGQGISIEEQDRLFRKFERLTPRPTAGESSSGLGLYLVRQMILKMGGRVWCESKLGSGSTFHLSVPIEPPAQRSPQ